MEKFIHSLEEDDFDVDGAVSDLVEGVADEATLSDLDQAQLPDHLRLLRNWKRKLRDFERCKSEEVGAGQCDALAEDVYRYSFDMVAMPAKTIDAEWKAFDDCAVQHPKDPRACSDAFRALWRRYDLELQGQAGRNTTQAQGRRKDDM